MPPPSPSTLQDEAETLAEALPPLLAEAERVANTLAQGIHGRRRTGQGESFWQFRRYHEGDPANSIDWRRSARSRHLFVRETEWEAAESVWIWRDPSASMDYASDSAPCTKRDRATVLTLALTSILIRGGERVAPLGTGLTPSSSRAGLRRMAHTLLDQPDTMEAQTQSLPPTDPLPRYAQLVLISDFLAPLDDIIPRLRRFADQGIKGHLVQVLDPAEEDLPFTGRTEFEGIEEKLRLLVGRVEILREAYHDRLMARRAALMDVARDLEWTFAAHRTDRPPQTALLALYGALAGTPGARAMPPRAGL